MDDSDRRGGSWILGWTCIVLGLIGLALPALLGILLLAIGLLLLLRHSETARRMIKRLRGKFPAMADAFDRAEARMRGKGAGGGTPE